MAHQVTWGLNVAHEWKVGDRILVTKKLVDYSYPSPSMYDLVGSILEVTNTPDSRHWIVAGGFCWTKSYAEECLAGVTLESACSTYTAACERFEAAQAELERAKQAVADARIDVARALEMEP